MTNNKPSLSDLIYNSDDREDLINAFADNDTETIEAITDDPRVIEALRDNRHN